MENRKACNVTKTSSQTRDGTGIDISQVTKKKNRNKILLSITFIALSIVATIVFFLPTNLIGFEQADPVQMGYGVLVGFLFGGGFILVLSIIVVVNKSRKK